MDSKHIEQLLDRYWRCETSLEEEAQLRDFFNGKEVPAHLLPYKDLFAYQRLQQEARLSDDFDARVLATIGKPVVKARRMTLWARFTPLFKAAAVVAVVVVLGGVVQHSFLADADEVPVVDTIGKQISAPSVALSEERCIAHEQSPLDTLPPQGCRQKEAK